jgi:DNA-binding IclR family transcriptional regulator
MQHVKGGRVMSTEGRGVQSIEVGGRILQVLVDAEQPMMLRDIAKQAGMLPAQAHAYLVSYRKQSLVDQDEATGHYRLGSFALQLGIARMRSFDPLRMASELLPDLADLTGFTIALSIWGTHGPTVIQIHEGVDQLYTNTRAGTVYSIAGTATGRVFAAFMPDRIVRMALENESLEGTRSKRIGISEPVQAKALRAAIVAIRREGYSTIDPQPVPGVAALSAPVFDHMGHIQMAITVIGPARTMDTTPASPVVPKLLAFASQLSAQLGYDGGESVWASRENAQAVSRAAKT